MAKTQIIIVLCLIALSGAFCGCSRTILGRGALHTPAGQTNAAAKRGVTITNATAFITGAALAVLAASGKDRQISSYATDRAPVYGSRDNASGASQTLAILSAATAAALYVARYFPLRDRPADYPQWRYPQIHSGGNSAPHLHLGTIEAFEAAALSGMIALPATDLLKKYTGRPRPDRSDDESFPSGHAAFAAWANAYSAKMISMMDLPPAYSYPAYGALTAMTLGTAWGRVEGARHYPSDVLAGILVSLCLTDAAFAVFQEDSERIRDVRFGITFTNVRAAATTTLAATIDF